LILVGLLKMLALSPRGDPVGELIWLQEENAWRLVRYLDQGALDVPDPFEAARRAAFFLGRDDA
jgi:hypothetical protein